MGLEKKVQTFMSNIILEQSNQLRLSLFAIQSASFGVLSLPLREGLRTHKVFTKDQCFYLYYLEFSIKSYVLDVY